MQNDTRGSTIAVRNPRTGQLDYQITTPTKQKINVECNKLREAQTEWASVTLADRIGVMRHWADEVEKQREAIVKAESADTGRYRIASESPDAVIWGIRGWCERAPDIFSNALNVGQSTTMPFVKLRQQFTPYPLLGIISPWNFPLMLSSIDAIPALIAGCAAIIKPSEVTPRFIEPIRETISKVPELDKVLTYVAGAGETGQDIIDNVDILCFTGSVPTGRKVAEACARNFIPVFLELGGKDPVIITKSADIDRATDSVLRGSVFATGQICFSLERIYVDEKIHDAFVDQLVEKAEELELSDGDIHRGHLGPLIFEKQATIIDDQIDDALEKGARIRTGGKSEKRTGGLYVRPTVITNVTHDMDIMRNETFGPVMPVMKFSSVEDAITLANDSQFGLSGAVIAGSEEEGAAIAAKINVGGVSVNDTTLTGAILRDAEKNSFNLSGMGGSRMGGSSILRFLRKKAIIINPERPVKMLNLAEYREQTDKL